MIFIILLGVNSSIPLLHNSTYSILIQVCFKCGYISVSRVGSDLDIIFSWMRDDSIAMILLTIPIFSPILVKLDFGMSADHMAIWFGILVLMAVEL